MGKEALEGIVTVATIIVGIAFVAVLVSKNSQTASVLTAGGQALASALTAATAPASGGNATNPFSAVSTELGQTGTGLGNYITV